MVLRFLKREDGQRWRAHKLHGKRRFCPEATSASSVSLKSSNDFTSAKWNNERCPSLKSSTLSFRPIADGSRMMLVARTI